MRNGMAPKAAQTKLEKQIEQLASLRNAGTRAVEFREWRQTTLTLIERIWPDQPTRATRFRRIPFSPTDANADDRIMRDAFERGCAEARRLLKLWLAEIGSRGVTQDAEAPRLAEAVRQTLVEMQPHEPLDLDDDEAPESESPPRHASSRAEAPPRHGPPRAEAPPRQGPPRAEAPRQGPPRAEAPPRQGPPRAEAPPRPGPPRAEAPPKQPPAHADPPPQKQAPRTPAPSGRGKAEGKPAAKPARRGRKEPLGEMLGFERTPPEMPPEFEASAGGAADKLADALAQSIEKALEGARRESHNMRPPSEPMDSRGRSYEPTPVGENRTLVSYVARAFIGLAGDVEELGVPEGHCERVRLALLDLAQHLDAGNITWQLMRDAVTLVMHYPALGRQALPLLLPYLENAA